MHPRVQISGGLFAAILTIFLHVSQMLYLPTALIRFAGQEAWLSVMISALGGGLIGLFGVWVSMRHPKLLPAQIAREVLGKGVGGAMGLVYAGFMTWIYAVVSRDILDFSQMVLLPETPGTVLAALMAVAALYAAWEGLESIARIGFLVMITVVLTIGILPPLVIQEISLFQVEPFLWHGIRPVLWAGLLGTPWFADSVVAMALVPTLKHPRQAYRWFLVGVTGAAVLLGFIVALTNLVFGPELAGRFTFAVHMMIQQVTIGRTIERIEVVLITVWLCGMFVKLALSLWAAAEACSQSFGLKTHRWPAVVLTLIGVPLTQIWSTPLNLVSMTTNKVWVLSSLAVQAGIPAVLLLASLLHAAWRRKGSTHA